MSIKSKVLVAAATMAMVAGVSAVGLLPAQASTPSCEGSTTACPTINGEEYGAPFVLDVLRQGEKLGQAVIMFRTSNSDPAEDFTVTDQGLVSTFYTDGLVSAGLDQAYGADTAYELEYAPYGVASNLCAGVASTVGNGTPVALEPCGASSKTLWVADTGADASGAYYPLINGSDTNFSDPFVLHYPGNAYPTDMPRPQLNTYNLQKYSSGAVFNNEEWTGIATLT